VVGDNERGIELEILDRLGVGGSGIVYKAKVLRQPSGPPLPDVVAVKAISTAGLSQAHEVRVKEEIKIHKSLKHKNIVRLLSFFTDESYVFLVMELCDGGDLERVIGRQGLSEADARSYLEQILNAIEYFHSIHSVFHRDLKASNVLLASDGTAKICDFGLAKVQSSPREIHMTMCGTPRYDSPNCIVLS
jgi:serine/threonine protein kinase